MLLARRLGILRGKDSLAYKTTCLVCLGNMANDQSQPRDRAIAANRQSGYRRYIVTFALLALVRTMDAVTDGAPWRIRAYDSQACWVAAPMAAILVCFIATSVARKHYPIAITILLSILIGATTTLFVSTFPGMVVGLIVGVIATLDVSRWLVFQLLKYVLLAVIPAIVIGVTLGFLGSMTVLRVEGSQLQFRAAMLVCLLLVSLAMVWTILLVRWRRERSLMHAAAILLCFMAASLVTFPLGIQLDNERRMSVVSTRNYFGVPVPRGHQNLVRGYWEPGQLWLPRGVNREQGKLLKPFKSIGLVYLDQRRPGIDFHSDGFEELDLSGVNEIASWWRHSAMTDQALLAFRESALNKVIILSGSDVTDQGLAALERMNGLFRLDLSYTRINGSGFKHLHPRAPLNFVALRDTPLTDEALVHFAGRATEHLDVSGTRITGSGFQDVDLNSLRVLNLAKSEFREEYIDLLPRYLKQLNISGTKLSPLGTKKLAARFARRRTGYCLHRLVITDSEIDDVAMVQLANMRIEKLEIDATHLTTAACRALADATAVELVYQANDTLLEDIIKQYQEMREEIIRIKTERLRQSVAPQSIGFAIRGLTVRMDMLEKLRPLECVLYEATVAGDETSGPQDLDMDDLALIFVRREHELADAVSTSAASD